MRAKQDSELYGTATSVNFAVVCPHCGKNLEGEEITEISSPSWRTFFYTESDHQLAYIGERLESVSCLKEDELRGGRD